MNQKNPPKIGGWILDVFNCVGYIGSDDKKELLEK